MAMQTSPMRDGDPVSEINTTPLIDVMLVLLIMLIVTLPPQRHAVKLDTPREAPQTMNDPPKPVRIAVEFDGAILWNGAPVSYAELDSRLSIESRRPMQPEIHVEPDRLAKYEYVVHVMAAAERLGLTKIGIASGN